MNTKKLAELFGSSKDKYGDARKMGVSYQSILNIIYGSDVKVSTLEKIARYYHVPVGYFFDEAQADGLSSKEAEITRLQGEIEGLKDAVKILRDTLSTK